MVLNEGIIEFCSMFQGTAFSSKPKHDNVPVFAALIPARIIYDDDQHRERTPDGIQYSDVSFVILREWKL